MNELMRSIGLRATRSCTAATRCRALSSGRIPLSVDRSPDFGVGKYTTAFGPVLALRALWLASGGSGPLTHSQPGFTPADGRYLLWLLAHVSDVPKIDRVRIGLIATSSSCTRRAGSTSARHDAGLVFWRGGVFVVGVMTWSSRGVGTSADVLAGRVAAAALDRFSRTEG